MIKTFENTEKTVKTIQLHKKPQNFFKTSTKFQQKFLQIEQNLHQTFIWNALGNKSISRI
jgi:hypothetical protein